MPGTPRPVLAAEPAAPFAPSEGEGADIDWEGSGDGRESFALRLNRKRAPADPWVDAFVVVRGPVPLAALPASAGAGAGAAANEGYCCKPERAVRAPPNALPLVELNSRACTETPCCPQGTYTVALLRWQHLMPVGCVAAFAMHCVLCALRAWLAAAHPAAYLRWQELVVSVLTVSTLASPIPTAVLLDMAR